MPENNESTTPEPTMKDYSIKRTFDFESAFPGPDVINVKLSESDAWKVVDHLINALRYIRSPDPEPLEFSVIGNLQEYNENEETGHDKNNIECSWNDLETFANPVRAGLDCTCKNEETGAQ